jgi:hypothetical protein
MTVHIYEVYAGPKKILASASIYDVDENGKETIVVENADWSAVQFARTGAIRVHVPVRQKDVTSERNAEVGSRVIKTILEGNDYAYFLDKGSESHRPRRGINARQGIKTEGRCSNKE